MLQVKRKQQGRYEFTKFEYTYKNNFDKEYWLGLICRYEGWASYVLDKLITKKAEKWYRKSQLENIVDFNLYFKKNNCILVVFILGEVIYVRY